MQQKTFCLENVTPLNRQQVEILVHTAGEFSSRIIFTHKTRVINGKSMLGLLSIGITGKDPVLLTTEGEDEEAAMEAISALIDSGIAPPKNAQHAKELLAAIKERFVGILQDNLVGLYLYGSLAAGCFVWERSNIDFLVIVHKQFPVEKKIALVETLFELEKNAPPEGFDMYVLQENQCRAPHCPMSYLLHYRTDMGREYSRGPYSFCERMHGEDEDLTLHLVSTLHYGIPFHGPSVPRVFGQVRRSDVLLAIRDKMQDAGEKLHERPVFYVLNLCRFMAYAKENTALNKKEGGEWGLKHCKTTYQGVIQAALNAYLNGRDMFYDRAKASDFCFDALDVIMEAE